MAEQNFRVSPGLEVGAGVTIYGNTGIISATAFYGSGLNLTDVISGVGISSSGTLIGTAVTTLNFVGVGNSFIYNPATNTVDIIALNPSINKQSFTVGVGGTDTFTLSNSYHSGFIDVFVNGSRLSSADFTETLPNIITLSVAAIEGDIVEFQAYNSRVENVTQTISANLTNIEVTGISTLGTVEVSGGIVTATSGIVTYYGDGSNLSGLPQSGIGINTAGGNVGYGVTLLDFRGAGVSTITAPVSGISTINITGGGSSGSISISTEAPSNPDSGDLWYSPDYARTFIYYDESAVGYGADAYWIDAAPFISGGGITEIVSDTTPQLGGNLDLNSNNITGTGNININGTFIGDGSGLTGVTGTGSGVEIRDNNSAVGTASTINFGNGLSVSPVSVGLVTITSGLVNDSTPQLGGNLDLNSKIINGTGNIDYTGNFKASGIATATTFVGNLTGTATEATNVTVSANNTTNETVYPVFVDGATGTQGAETDTGLTYNPNTGNLTATKFSGDGSSITGISTNNITNYGVGLGGGGSTSTTSTINYEYDSSGTSRTLQNRLEDYVSVKDYGAVGNGTTDDTTAIQNALDNGGCVYFPEGVYKITQPIVVDQSVHIMGAGPKTVILCSPSSSSSDAWIHLKYASAAVGGDKYQISDIQIQCDRFGTINTAIRLEYTGASGVVGEWGSLDINNVRVSTNEPAYTSGYFKRGLHILNAGGINVNNFQSSTGIVDTEEDADTIGIHIENTKNNHFMIRTLSVNNFFLARYNKCLLSEKTGTGSNIESCYLSQGEILGNSGVNYDNIHATAITSCHFDCRGLCINIDSDGGPHRVIGNDIRSRRLDGNGSVISYNTFLMKVATDRSIISGNYIECQSPTLGAIDVGGNQYNFSTNNVIISDNVIRGNDAHTTKRAIIVNSNSTEIHCSNNEFLDWNYKLPFTDNSSGGLYISNHAINTDDTSNSTQLYTGNGQLYGTDTVLPGISNTNTGAHIQPSSNGTSLHISHDNNVCGNYNRNSDGAILAFRRSGTTQGSVTITTTAVAYNSNSDYRLKTNVVPLDNSIDRVKQLNPVSFNWISNNEPDEGFIAHEVGEVYPKAITNEKDGVDENGDPIYQMMDYGSITPLLASALKEVITKIEQLEARIARLE